MDPPEQGGISDEKKTDEVSSVKRSRHDDDDDDDDDDEVQVVTETIKKPKLLVEVSSEEASLRYDLAVGHRWIAKLGYDMMVWNHMSARMDAASQNYYLVTPGRQLWHRIRPADVVKQSDNCTANVIHSAIYQARSDIRAILHLHTPAATAVSCLKCGFKALCQDAAYFYNKVAYYDWDGVSNDKAEGPALMKAVHGVPNCNTLVMNNHGFVCFGASVKEVVMLAYYFERCCDVQLRAMSSGAELREPPRAVMETAAKTSYLPDFAPGNCEWDAMCAEIDFDN